MNARCSRATSSGPPGSVALTQIGSGPGQVGALHLVDDPLQRSEPALEERDVEDDRERDREPEDHAGLGPIAQIELRVGGQDGPDHGGHDEQQVHRQHLGEEVATSHLALIIGPKQAAPQEWERGVAPMAI